MADGGVHTAEVWQRDGRSVVVEATSGVVMVSIDLMRQMLTDLGYATQEQP
ncbi:hypothetical protein [Actinotalea ferrariae]|uniref:hypothetical protein n=1 Tax=Actinotalea ferrariae TaxID=1386098 RepID=UPI0012DCA5E4|nr:hypothetical protein [Actinotalea ferrariae]